jgi:peptidoglycan/xylan/chitin deacetylase (PgdA/CDA1 family)
VGTPAGAISSTLAWRMRSMLSPTGRKRARRIVDRVLGPLSSISGLVEPSQWVALTFDDGPDAETTPRLLDLLKLRGVRATFFVLTEKALRHPDLIRRIVAEGHEIGLHADVHTRLTTIAMREAKRRLAAARDVLERVSGRPVRYFRPPFGAQSLATYFAARAARLEVVVWSQDAHDWVEGPPEEIAAFGLRNLEGGGILLLHDGLEIPAGEPIPTFDRIRAFTLILDGLAARGFGPVPVGHLLSTGTARRTAWFRP